MTKDLAGKDILPRAPSGETHELPLRRERTRPKIPLSAVLEKLTESSPELEGLGVAPAALEAGLKIRLARLQKGISQSALAKMARISQPALSYIEQGRGSDGPSYTTLRQLTQALGIELMPGMTEAAEGVELSLESATGNVAEKPSGPVVPAADIVEFKNADKLFHHLIDGKLLLKIRKFVEDRVKSPGEGTRISKTRLLAVDANRSAHLRVRPMTTLMVHGTTPFISRDEGAGAGLEFILGNGGQQVAMVSRPGLLKMRNHGSDTVLVFAVPTHALSPE